MSCNVWGANCDALRENETYGWEYSDLCQYRGLLKCIAIHAHGRKLLYLAAITGEAKERLSTLTITHADCGIGDGFVLVCRALAFSNTESGQRVQLEMLCYQENATCVRLRRNDSYTWEYGDFPECDSNPYLDRKAKQIKCIAVHSGLYDTIYLVHITEASQ